MQRKKAFTIVEVALVLAVIGLIILMIFVGYPMLKRSQEDTQRKDDLVRVATAMTQYAEGNSGRLPWYHKSANGDGSMLFRMDERFSEHFVQEYVDTGNENYRVAKIVAPNYGIGPGSGCTDKFRDPDGTCYGMSVVGMSADSMALGENFNIAEAIESDSSIDYRHVIFVLGYTECSGQEGSVTMTKDPGVASLVLKSSNGPYLCADNAK